MSRSSSRIHTTLVTASRDQQAQLWETESGKLLTTFQGHSTVLERGDDDLRGGPNAGDNCDVTVQLASGNTIRINNVNAGQNWKNRSVNTVTIPSPEGGLKGGDVKAVTLHTGFGGGISGDNWNVNRLQLQATLK